MLLDLGRATNVTETVLRIADQASDEAFCLWAKLLIWWKVATALSVNDLAHTRPPQCRHKAVHDVSNVSNSDFMKHSHKHR